MAAGVDHLRDAHARPEILKIFHGTKVIEVLPQVAWTKGECAQWIQERMSPTLTGLGDDWTGEHAFEVLRGQALTSRVGDAVPASKAAYRLQDVSEVHQLLAALAAGAAAGSRV